MAYPGFPRDRDEQKGRMAIMFAQTPNDDLTPRPSRVIAEALVKRHGPSQITRRALRAGYPRQLTHVIVAACAATACDTKWVCEQSSSANRC